MTTPSHPCVLLPYMLHGLISLPLSTLCRMTMFDMSGFIADTILAAHSHSTVDKRSLVCVGPTILRLSLRTWISFISAHDMHGALVASSAFQWLHCISAVASYPFGYIHEQVLWPNVWLYLAQPLFYFIFTRKEFITHVPEWDSHFSEVSFRYVGECTCSLDSTWIS